LHKHIFAMESQDVRILNAEQLVSWFRTLGPEYAEYGSLLEGTTGRQLYFMRNNDLKNFILDKVHLQTIVAAINESTRLAPHETRAFRAYKTRLTEILTKHNPEKLNTVDYLLKQFPNKEHQVYIQICKKCGVPAKPPPDEEEYRALDAALYGANDPPGFDNKSDKDLPDLAAWLEDNGFGKHIKEFKDIGISSEQFFSIASRGKLIEMGIVPKQADKLLEAIQRTVGSQAEGADDFQVGENCYTKVLSRRGDERWLNARITHVNGDNTYDIFVYQSAAHGVAPEAVNVKREFLKKLTEQVVVAQPPKKEHPRFEQGDRVRVFGLRSHTSYNGLCGTVILYVPSERRYQVRLDTKDVIAIKQRNVCPENDEDQAGQPQANQGAGWRKKPNKNDDIDEQSLSQLMAKMLAENPDTDPAKLGEFAAGYLRAKKKIQEMENNS